MTMVALAGWLSPAAHAQTFNQELVTEVAMNANVTGSATAAPNDLASFSEAVGDSLGGVFDFVGNLTAGTTIVQGTAGSDPRRMVRLTFTRPLQNFNNGATYTASSGSRGITTQTNPMDYGFAIGPVTDAEPTPAPLPNLNVTRLGFVAMSRTNAAGETAFPLDLRVTATLSNGLTQTATGALSGTRGQNVFFGFTAPTGSSIANISLQAFVSGTETPVIARIGLDDIVTIIEDTGPLVPGPSLTQITPENAFVAPGTTFNFGASSAADIEASNLSVVVNGVDAASQLVLGGTPTERIISITDLEANSTYEAVVTITNSTGIATRTYRFTTVEPLPTITEITPNGSYMTASGIFRFQVQSALTQLEPSNITVTLNGANVASNLTFQGGNQSKTVSISGLVPNTLYRAEVAATVATDKTTRRQFHFHTLGEPLTISDTRGFSDDTIYPMGAISAFVDGYSRWEPHDATANVAEIVDTGEPDYGKILRRIQGGGNRADYLYFPPLADGVLKVSFDVRVSNPNHRTLDVCVQPDSGNNQLMAGFIQFGRTAGKLSYFDNTNYIDIQGFELDTEWHRYELVHYYTGPNARTYDLYIDGNLISNIPWRNQTPLTLARIRFQAIARDVPLDETGHSWADIDNVKVTALPLRPAPLAAPVTVTELGQGVVYRKYTFTNLFASNQNIHVTEVNLEDPSVGIRFPYSGATRRTVPTHAANVPGAVAAVNGQFYNTAGSIQHLKVDGTLVNPTNAAHEQQALTDDGFGTRHSIKLVPRPGAGWDSLADRNIMATGPHLFQNGNKASLSESDSLYGRHPRTLAAWTYDNRLLLIVIDGRSGASAGMSYPEMQDYINTLGWIKNCTNYDGGGSSTMWTNGTVVNVPSDGSPRAVTNAIAVTAAPVAIPAAPTGIVAVEGEERFTLHWQVSSGATSYEVRRATSAEGPYVVLGNTTDPYFTDTTVEEGTDYFYVIVAKNSAGESVGSDPLATGVSDVIVVPSVLTSITGANFQITFDSRTGSKYQLERSTTLMGTWEKVGTPLNGTGGSLSFSEAVTPTNTFYRIRVE